MSQPFIGGTAAAALAGVNPPRWAQPIDVYQQLRGEAAERGQSRMMAMGHLMEELVASLFTEATGINVGRPARRAERTCSYLHPEGGCTAVLSKLYPWAGAHLDRWTGDGALLECKWSERRDEWGPGLAAGTVEQPTVILRPDHPDYVAPVVPLRYAVQVQHELAVTDRAVGYLAVLLGYGDFRWYALWRNEAMIGQLMELEERFWNDNYLAGVPPEPDGSEAYGRHLRRRYAADEGEERVATPEQARLAEQLRTAKRHLAQAELEVERHAQAVQHSMGSTAKLIGDGFTITWRQNKPTVKVQWKPLATTLAERLEVADWPKTKKAQEEYMRQVARGTGHLVTEPGARPFLAEFASDESQEE